ncbi:MAG: GAF domain-containing protein [Anaerolineae bacterium]|nr:GAF domain-containing protein [Anaerolineae bacterium]MBT7075733.1 GAF domain-containing protein [Anaerolineae bacterium]MBT7782630.1 GAF domain-containing protein [Anaerolineae bacterium]
MNSETGLILIASGLAIGVLIWILTRWALRSQPSWQAAIKSPTEEMPDHGDAVLLIQAGGRVNHINTAARKLFSVTENETPNLERLARRARPSDAFWKLCTSEGKMRFSVGGKLIEGISYQVPGVEPTILLSLRRPELNSGIDGTREVSGSVLGIITDFGQEIAENLNLDATLMAVLENVEKLLPSDILEIKIWEQASQTFISYRFGMLDGLPRLERSLDTRFGNYSAYLSEHKEFLFVSDTESYKEIRFLDETDQYSIRSYMGAPLLAGRELVGMLEVGQIAVDMYSNEDKNLLQLVAGQAAVAIRNALLYENEQRRAMELSGLANLAQSAGSLQNREEFFGALINSIQPLFAITTLGFLLFDEDRRILEGQIPFEGIPSHIVAIYRTEIKADSVANAIIEKQQILLTEDAKTDKNWEELRIHNIAQAASLQESALVPLSSSGRFLGYLQLSNHTQGIREFTKNEIHLMSVVANQTATIIDNASLVQQTRQRARRAETMRRVASLVSSSATEEETIRFSIQELVQLINTDAAIVFLLDDNEGALVAHETSLYGKYDEDIESIGEYSKLYIDDPQYRLTVTGSQRSFISGNLRTDNRVLDFYRPLVDAYKMLSALVVPIVIRERGVGELMLTSRLPDFFTRYDLQSARTVADQLSVRLEASKSSEQTDESLRLRVEELSALSRVNRELSGSLDLKHLLEVVYEEGLQTSKADCGTITIFDLDSIQKNGVSPKSILALGCARGVPLSANEREVIDSGNLLIVDDIDDDEYPASHEGVRSALIAPIAYQGKTVGLFHLHSKSPDHFNETTLNVIKALVVQAAIAMGNAYSYEKQVRYGGMLEQRASALSSLLDTTTSLEVEQPLSDSLQIISSGICEATTFDVVLVSVYDAGTEMMRRIIGTGISEENWNVLRERDQPFLGVQQLLKPEFMVGSAYYVPTDKAPIMPSDLHIISSDNESGEKKQGVWHSEDLFLFLLKDQYDSPLGMISLDQPRDGVAPDLAAVEAIEVFAAQAALVISNHARLSEYKERVNALSSGIERQQRLLDISQNDLPILLHKDLEQTITIQNLDRVSYRVRAGLQITESVSRQVDASSALQALGREILTHMGMMTAFVAENTAEGPQLLHAMGDVPRTINPDALFGQRNPLRACLRTGNVMLVMNLDENDEWREAPLLSTLQSKSFIALPIKVEGETVAAVLAVSRESLPILTDEDEQVYYQIARQSSVIFQNIHLLTSIQRRLKEVNLLLDFSRTLSNLGPASIMEALLTSALQVISAAHAGIILLWNEVTERLEPQAVQNYANSASMKKISYRFGEALPGNVFAKRQSHNIDEVNFTRDYTLSASQLLLYRQATGGRMPISSLLVPIQTGEYCLGVLVLDNFNKAGAFQKEDETLLLSLSQQVALSLQNLRLIQSTEERATQLEALTDITSTITSSLQSEELIPSLLSQLESVIPYDRAMLWLYERNELRVVTARGFKDDRVNLKISDLLEEAVLIEEILRSGKAITVPDMRVDDRFQIITETEYLSWLGIPLLSKGEVVGVMTLDKKEAGFYMLTHIQIGATFAGQAAVSLENARLYQSTLSTAKRLEILNAMSAEVSANLETEKIYHAIYEAATRLMPVESFEIALYNEEEKQIKSVHHVIQNRHLAQKEIPLDSNPIGKVMTTGKAILLSNITDTKVFGTSISAQAKMPFSILAVPMRTGDQVVGVLVAQSAQHGIYTDDDQQILSTLGNQGIIAIQNGRLFAETQTLTETLEQRVVERTAELESEQRNTKTLLDILTEVSSSLDLDLALNQTLALLNETVGAEQGTVMLLNPEDNLLHYRAGYGYLSNVKSNGKSFKLKVGEGLAGWVVKHRDAILIDDLDQDERWVPRKDDFQRHRSAVAAPLMVGEDIIGVLLVFNRKVNFFDPDQLILINVIAGQVAVAINNANLYKLIREQAERLGHMLRSEQEEATRSQAILEAVADGVLVTDSENRISFMNASAEKILSIEGEKVKTQTLKDFSGLFGKAANTWHEIIRGWSENPSLYQEGDTYAEQLTLENGRIVLVHLAPVMIRTKDFLGTVSIFRDITHQVEVDRLKSEFVATVSHELRTPMTSIRGYVDILLMGAAGALSENQTHFLDIIRENTERLNILVTDLLDISRIESGKITLSPQPIVLKELAEDAITSILRRSQEDEKPMAFSLEVEPDLPSVYADADRTRQIVNNLVENAYNYTPENGKIIVQLHKAKEADEVQIDIQDNGVGIAVNDQEQVFERFYRGEDPLVLATPGTGLGLPIVKQLVEMHNGHIWVKSSGKDGEGSVFSFTLPVYSKSE